MLQIRQKRGSSGVIEWALGLGLGEDAAQWGKVLRACVAAILTAGAKTVTHMDTYVARYEALMRFLLLKAGSQARPCALWVLWGSCAAAQGRRLGQLAGAVIRHSACTPTTGIVIEVREAAALCHREPLGCWEATKAACLLC